MINLLLVSIFLSSIAIFGLCLFSYLAGNRYKTFLVFNLNIAIFYLFYGLSIVAQDYQSAFLYAKISLSLSYLISLLSQYFAAEFSGIKHKKYLVINSALTVVLIVITALTPYFITSVKPFMDFKYSVQTTDIFRYIYFPYFLINVIYSHYLIFQASKNDPKAKYIFLALFFGYCGGCTIIFQYYAIEIYPLGNFTVIFYATFMAYGITKYRFFNSSLIFSKSLTRIAALIALAICYLVLYSLYYLLFPIKNALTNAILNISFLIFACETYQFFMSKFQDVQKHLFKVEFKTLDNVTEEMRQNLSDQTDLTKLNKFIQSLFYYKIPLELNFIAINENHFDDFLYEEEQGPDYKVTLNPKDAREPNFTKYHEEISKLEATTCYQDANNKIKELLDSTESSSLVPFIYKKEVIGFILVKERGKNHFFTHEDILVFDNLSWQIGIALENVNSNNKLQDLENVKKQSKEYKALAGSIAHEVRNPLNSINVLGAQIKDILNNNEDDLFSSQNFDVLQNAASHSPTPKETGVELSNVLLKYRRNKNALSSLTSKISDSIYLANNIINIILGDLKDKAIDPSDLEFINLSDLLPTIIAKYGYKSDMAKAALTIDHDSFKNDRGNERDIYIKAVDERLTFTIYNILKNALIYVNDYPSLKVEISIEEAKLDSQNIEGFQNAIQDYVIINITDYNGPGISKENIDKIFEDFFTAEKSGQGSGLGLAFCQRNMRLFGGHIKCESKINEYTKFSLCFPKPTKDEVDNIDSYQKQTILTINQDKKFIQTIENNLDIICENISCDNPNLGNLIFKNTYKLIIFSTDPDSDDKKEDPLLKHLRSYKNINKEGAIIAHINNCSFEDFPKPYKSLLHYYINHQEDQSYNIFLRTISKLTTSNPNKEIDLSYIKQDEIDLTKYKMIFADDNDINLKVTKNALENIGLSVTPAIDGRELLNIFKEDLESQVKSNKHKSSFNLILTDINMPYIVGNKAAQEIRKIEEKLNIKSYNQVPIIVTTGNIVNADSYYYESESENIFNRFETGVNDYFLKGNDPNSLIKLLKVYLK